jgi:CRP/FNR family transcriptional regulator, nitrogen fixation regulation protein
MDLLYATQAPASVAEDAARLVAHGAMENLATLFDCRAGDTVYFQDDRADYWYRIVSGAARECALTADGRRQIVDFPLRGDVFGFCTHGTHPFSGEIIADATTVARYPRRRVEQLAETDPEVARQIREIAFESIERLQTRMALLGRSSAQEKVSAFLLEMAERCAAGPEDSIVLPMSRYDIADYLALAVETVSRTLTALRQHGVIAFTGVRQVRIVDRALLAAAATARAAGAAPFRHGDRSGSPSPAVLRRIQLAGSGDRS